MIRNNFFHLKKSEEREILLYMVAKKTIRLRVQRFYLTSSLSDLLVGRCVTQQKKERGRGEFKERERRKEREREKERRGGE